MRDEKCITLRRVPYNQVHRLHKEQRWGYKLHLRLPFPSLLGQSTLSYTWALHPSTAMLLSIVSLVFAYASIELSLSVIAAPAGVPSPDPIPFDLPGYQSPGPPGASGSLSGPQGLLGPDGNPVDVSEIGTVRDYRLVPGQSEDADLGLYLDLSATDDPQPLRGSLGGTDPGPSIYSLSA